MGKVSKYSNLYNKDGEIIRSAPLKPYTIEDLEELIDNMQAGKARESVMWRLFDLYNKYGNPHEKELIDKIKQSRIIKTDEDQVRRTIGDLGRELELSKESKGSIQSEKDEIQKVTYDVNTLDTEDAIIIEDYDIRKS